jgi:hypothetical protein
MPKPDAITAAQLSRLIGTPDAPLVIDVRTDEDRAAVVGVILNLAVWFGVHVVVRETVPWHGYGLSLSVPVLPTIDILATIISIAAALAIFRFKIGVTRTLLARSIAGVVPRLMFGAAL